MPHLSPRPATALALLASLTLAACTGPPVRTDGGSLTAEPDTCGAARPLLADARWDDALVELRVIEGADPVAAASPYHDVCVARAMIGGGRATEAVELLEGVPYRADAEASRTACLYTAWARFAEAADPAPAATALAACDPLGQVAPRDALLETDRSGAALVLVAGRAERDLARAVPGAEELLLDPATTPATRRWLLQFLLEAAVARPEADLSALRQASDTLGPALAGYAELTRAADAGEHDRARALLPDVRARLLALGAEPEALSLEERIGGDEPARAALFGAILNLSGPARQVGRAQLAGLLLAEDVFAGTPASGEPSRLLVVDAGETAASAATAVADLDAAGVIAVIGPFERAQAEAAMAEAEARGVPFVSLSDAVDPPPDARCSVRLFPSPEAEARALVTLATEEGAWRVAIAAPDPAPPYLDRLIESFRQEAASAGVRVTTVERYLVSDLQPEAARVAERLAREDFEALLIADQGGNATTLAAYLGTHDIWARAPGRLESGDRRFVTLLGTSFWHDPEFLREGPDYLEGGLFPAWLPSELGYEATTRFVDSFSAAYGRRPGLLGAYAHDALELLRYLVIDSGVRTRSGLAEAIVDADLVGAATGELHFGPDRASAQQPFILRVTSTGFEPR